jgi:hypothetical protein
VERNKNLERYLKDKCSSSKDMVKKFQFLEKLMIEKDNNLHALNKKVKESIS